MGFRDRAVRKGFLEEGIFKLIRKVREQPCKQPVEEHSRQEEQEMQGLQGYKRWPGSKLEWLEGDKPEGDWHMMRLERHWGPFSFLFQD